MAPKSKSKRSNHSKSSSPSTPTPPVPPTQSNPPSSSSGLNTELMKSIVAHYGEAQTEFMKGKPKNGLKLVRKFLNKYENVAFVHRLGASLLCLFANDCDRVAECNKYWIMGLESAKKAIEFEPKCIEYTLYFVTKFLDVAERVQDCEVMRRLCETALLLHNPVDLPERVNLVTVDSSDSGVRIAAVQEELRKVIQKVNDLEEEMKKWERKNAEEKTCSAKNEADAAQESETSMSDLVAKTADLKMAMDEDIPDCVTQGEESKEAEHSVAAPNVEQKLGSTSEMATVDQNITVEEEVPVTQDVQSKDAEHIMYMEYFDQRLKEFSTYKIQLCEFKYQQHY